MLNAPLINTIIMMIIAVTGDIRAFMADRPLGMMTLDVTSARLEDVCKRFRANI